MKKLAILFSFMLGLFPELRGQCPNDIYTGYGSPSNDSGQMILSDSLQNVYLSGFFTTSIQIGSFTLFTDTVQQKARFLCKIDPSGSVVWAKKLYDFDMTSLYVPSMKLDHSGQLVMTGICDVVGAAFDTIASAFTNGDMFIAKFNPVDGTLNSFLSTGRHLWLEVTDFDIDLNDNLYITGLFVGIVNFTGISMTCTGTGNTFVVKFNPQNQAQWAHRITTSPPVSGNKANSIDVDNHSHLYISGWYGINADFGNGIALNSTSSKNGYIARYDINGNVIWAKSSDSLVIYNHQVVTDTNSITVIESSPDKFINYDQNGNVVSSRTVTLLSPGSGSYFNQLVAHKGKYFVTGTIYDSLYIDGVNYQFPGYNAFVGCFDASDSLIWIRAIQNSSYCQSFDISIDSQDHIYMTGSYGPHDTINQTVVMPWWGSSDVLFVKLCNGAVSLNEASGNEMVQLFPNPVSSELNVRFYDSGFISVFDVLGNLVFELDVADRQVDELELDVSFLNSGIYFVRVGDRIGKFVKQ